MRVEVVTIGDELLLGHTIDTNAAWLARELAAVGISIVRRCTVGDAVTDIAAAVGEALARTGGVITTGGLGPTSDDRTKPAIAALFGRALCFDDVLWQGLRQMWRDRGRAGEPPDANRQQVMIPEGAIVLPNRHGSAPGIFLTDDRGRWVAMLPGVPREMRGLFADELLPRLKTRLVRQDRVVRSLTLRTTGVAESQLPELLGANADGSDRVELAYLPSPEGVDLRLTVRNVSGDEADAALQAAASPVRDLLGRYRYAEGKTDLVEVVLELCRARSLLIAVAESCTGGLLGARLTSISGSSDVVAGGVIAYSNAVKERLLGVSPDTLTRFGAVSEPVAREMAAGVRSALKSNIGMAITGVAGPSGGTPDKPVGLVWIAVDFGSSVRTYGGRYFGDRAEIRFRATQSALDIARRELLDHR
jgi:competence/damage-inducible protein CinA-like protein